MLTTACCSVAGLGLGLGLDCVWFVSGYAHVFVLFSVLTLRKTPRLDLVLI